MGNILAGRVVDQDEPLDFSVYEAACAADADVQAFNNNLRERTNRALNAIANGGIDGQRRSLTFTCLKEVSSSLLEVDRDVMEVILQYKEDAFKSKELFPIVRQFFENSQATLEFCTTAHGCIENAKCNLVALEVACGLMPTDRDPTETEVQKILNFLDKFSEQEDPFGEPFFARLKAVLEMHVELLQVLRERKRKLDRKLKNVRLWSKLSSILFGAVVAAVLICSVVAAGLAVPHLAPALAAASSAPLTAMGSWIKSMWKDYENEIKGKRDLVQALEIGTVMAINDLQDIRNLVANAQVKLKRITSDIKLAQQNDPDVFALRLAMEDILKKGTGFNANMVELQVHLKEIEDRIVMARAIVLNQI